ncbi:hypothetical protein [Streptomyces sp. NPDC097619]|uniref:hypothetical protein n=1 Tax=Streptomyces sp. NPDC097619 TaxID=3157228 RepID=UPI00331B6175
MITPSHQPDPTTPGQPAAEPAPVVYAWPSVPEGPDPLPVVHFTTDRQEGGTHTEDGTPIWLFDLAIREGGWVRFENLEGWSAPAPGWQAWYRPADDLLVVRGPGRCAGWYEGSAGASEEWLTAGRTQGKLVLLAAPVPHPSDYAYAVEAGAGFALLVPLTVL